jgi:hypothetical protein
MFVFLGGTCNGSKWREELIPLLKCSYFNPVVEDWTPECIKEEYRQKAIATYELYVITPETMGCFSIAELIDATHDLEEKSVICALIGDWSSPENQRRYRSFNECLNLAMENGAYRFSSIKDIAEFLNWMSSI